MSVANPKKAILFLGLPGSGKTTQSVRLADALGFLHLTTSRIIRDKFKSIPPGEDSRIDEERKRYDEGKIVDPETVSLWVNEAIRRAYPQADGIILDGSPRSREEAEAIVPTFSELYGEENINIIYLEVIPETAFERSSRRLICVSCEKSYPQGTESRSQRCEEESCKGVLTRKLLDKPEIFQERLRLFKETTQEAIDFFNEKNMLLSVDGELEPDKVFRKILRVFR